MKQELNLIYDGKVFTFNRKLTTKDLPRATFLLQKLKEDLK